MTCNKGYKGKCCCECKSQLTIRVCSCKSCPTIKGYICTLPNEIDGTGQCYYQPNQHGSCECWTEEGDK